MISDIVDVVGPADALREHHASSSTRLFPVEMSRARKSSETICPDRFCGPPQHSKGQEGEGGESTKMQSERYKWQRGWGGAKRG